VTNYSRTVSTVFFWMSLDTYIHLLPEPIGLILLTAAFECYLNVTDHFSGICKRPNNPVVVKDQTGAKLARETEAKLSCESHGRTTVLVGYLSTFPLRR
jgi:hypothetical protein